MSSSTKSHHRTSSSDSFYEPYFSALTEEDFKKIDEAVARAWEKEDCLDSDDLIESDFPSEIDGLNFNLLTEAEWAKLDDLPDIEQPIGGNEGRFDSTSEISGTLIEGESETLSCGGPSIPIALEHCDVLSMQTKRLQSPLHQFRRLRVLSVTDLTSPTWCEVQYDYGLRGRRSRPIAERPVAFKSAAGKVISVENKVAQKNDIRTKQGQAIHKELQREIRAKELEVNATTKETRWALRIVNMMSCLKELLHGPRNMTREMPVFGILHDEVVVGIIDELVGELSVDCNVGKRKAKAKSAKGRPKKRRSPPDMNSGGQIESNSEGEEPKSKYTLHLRDAKTRKWWSIPEDAEALAGRLQLHIYFTLLNNLITLDPPFDFDVLWRKLGVRPDAKLPTKFLVQAQLISDNENLELLSLNDLVTSFYDLVRDQEMHISPFLELVYYLRRPKGKRVEHDVTGAESLSEAVVANCETPKAMHKEVGTSREPDIVLLTTKEPPSSQHDNDPEEVGIRRFPLIGKITFAYDEEEMNTHVARVLEWWHGKRPPDGVPIDLTKRCRTCEYSNDCEWRDAKASELRNSSGLVQGSG